MPTAAEQAIRDALLALARNDESGFRDGLRTAMDMARGRSPAELTAILADTADLVPRLRGIGVQVAILQGALVEWGASAVPLAHVAPVRIAKALEAAAVGAAPDDFDKWLMVAITLLAQREFRAAMHDRARLTAAAAEVAKASAVAGRDDRTHWVHGLTLVLDDEPLIVVDPASGRGYQLTMSGIGDNYQLHTLIADRVAGPRLLGRVGGKRPERAWVMAATTAPPYVQGKVWRRIRLFDALGAYMYPEGRPSDIAVVNGVRVLAVHPEVITFGWTNGRVYEHMVPTLTLDRRLTGAEAASWIARLAPKRETGLTG